MSDLKMKVITFIGDIKIRKMLTKEFRNMNFTKDNLIYFFNYLRDIHFNENANFIMMPIFTDDSYVWFQLKPKNDHDNISINIQFNISSPNILMNIVTTSIDEEENINSKSASYSFTEKIDIDKCLNKRISYETYEFLSTIMKVVSKAFIHTVFIARYKSR